MKNRVVVTGMGVVSPNGVGIPQFTEAIKNGVSGIRFYQELRDLNFSCQLGAMPIISEEKKREYLSELQLRNFNSSGILYGVIAGMDALKDAKLKPAKKKRKPFVGSGNHLWCRDKRDRKIS
jgi:3-oxoacyl-(acyl-carrier-protein) synthase